MSEAHTSPVAVIALCSDTHAGGTTALMPPSYTTSEGQTIQANRVQSYLWECWLDFCQQVKAAKRGGAFVYGVHVGDVTEGNHHDTVQILTVAEHDHAEVGVEVMTHFVSNVSRFAQVRGTETHVGASSSLETQVVKSLSAYDIDRPDDASDGVGVHGWTHRVLRRTIAGIRLNAAHHIGGGTTKRNTAIETAVEKHLKLCGEHGEPYAHYLVRAHKHRKADTGFSYFTRGMVLPAWQFPTAYVDKYSPDDVPMIGGVLIDIYADGTHAPRLIEYPFIKQDRVYKVVSVDGSETKAESKGKGRGDVRRVHTGRAARSGEATAGRKRGG